jgi:uncharacterized membrane protein
MVAAIEKFFLETVGKELCVFFCSILPIIECRGSIPLGFALGLPWWQTFLLSVIGNLLPVPFILLFMNKILDWMTHSRVKMFYRFGNWLQKKVEKNKDKIEKYSYLGVLIFVAVPFPGTGAWTGTLIASVLRLEPKKSFLAALGGVLIAATIMTVFSYSVATLAGC